MEIVVDDDQLSLAIGRRGQNVRLASQLTEWRIDIKTDSQMKREQQDVVSLLMSLPNVKEVTANLLYGEGYHKLEDIAFSDPETLIKSGGLRDEEEAEKMQTAARIALKDKLDQMTEPVDEVLEESEQQNEVIQEPEAEAESEAEVKESIAEQD